VAERTAYDYLKAQGIAITPQLLNNEPSTDVPAPAYTQEDKRKDTESESERPATPPAQTRSRVSTAFQYFPFSADRTRVSTFSICLTIIFLSFCHLLLNLMSFQTCLNFFKQVCFKQVFFLVCLYIYIYLFL